MNNTGFHSKDLHSIHISLGLSQNYSWHVEQSKRTQTEETALFDISDGEKREGQRKSDGKCLNERDNQHNAKASQEETISMITRQLDQQQIFKQSINQSSRKNAKGIDKSHTWISIMLDKNTLQKSHGDKISMHIHLGLCFKVGYSSTSSFFNHRTGQTWSQSTPPRNSQ